MDEQESIERRLVLARRRRELLEEQLAVFGRLNAPTHLQIQLEDVRAEIVGLEEQLARIQRGEPPPHVLHVQTQAWCPSVLRTLAHSTDVTPRFAICSSAYAANATSSSSAHPALGNRR